MRLRELQATYRAVPGAPAGPRRTITSGRAAAELIATLIDGSPVERMCMLCLDTRLKPIAFDVITVGTLDASIVHPREIFRTAILHNAAGFILAHNHPSGDPTPSPDDVAVTQRLRAAAEIMGITMIDHVIIGEHGSYTSFKESGL